MYNKIRLLPFWFILLCSLLFPQISTTQNKAIQPFPGSNAHLYTFVVTHDQEQVLYSDGASLWVFDLTTNALKATYSVNLGSEVYALAMGQNKNHIYLGTGDSRVVCFDTQAGALTHSVDLEAGRITGLALNAAEDHVISTSASGLVSSHEAGNLNAFREVFRHMGAVTGVSTLPTDKVFMIYGTDGLLAVFDDTSLESIARLETKHKCVRDLAFFDQRKLMISVGDDGRLLEWNTTSLKNIRMIRKTMVAPAGALCVDANEKKNLQCWGSMNSRFMAKVPFGTYKTKLDGPVLKATYLPNEEAESFICCVYGHGLVRVPLESMKFKFNRR